MSNNPNIIPGTIVIANLAQVVEPQELDVEELKASNLPKQTQRPFYYGDMEDPTKIGEPVKVIQGKYAFILVGIADEPVPPPDFFRLADVIKEELPYIQGVGTVRQDAVPVISEEPGDYTVVYSGDLKLIAYKTPVEPEVTPDVIEPELS